MKLAQYFIMQSIGNDIMNQRLDFVATEKANRIEEVEFGYPYVQRIVRFSFFEDLILHIRIYCCSWV